jgi:hypothetical protein
VLLSTSSLGRAFRWGPPHLWPGGSPGVAQQSCDLPDRRIGGGGQLEHASEHTTTGENAAVKRIRQRTVVVLSKSRAERSDHEEHPLRLVDFDVLTFDMIGTLIDFETGVLQFARPRILRVAPTATDTEVLECYAPASRRSFSAPDYQRSGQRWPAPTT